MTDTITEFKSYPKISGPYKRNTEGPDKNKLIIGQWSKPEFEYLQNSEWSFSEKINGMNIKILWNGYKTIYGGRTDKAQIPAKLVSWLNDNMHEELFEQKFGETPAILYGEGIGAGIQNGGNYSAIQHFVLFDVRIGRFWLKRDDIVEVAHAIGLSYVPIVQEGTLHEAIDRVSNGLTSNWGPFTAEGLVGVTTAGLLDRAGHRIQIKIKHEDFKK